MLDARSEQDFERVFGELTRSKASALIVTSDPFLLDRRKRLVALATQYAIPAVYAWRAFAVEGGLMSYGVNLTNEYRRVGNYVGRVLAGEKPADLPIEQPVSFQLVINLKAAKTLGLVVPPHLLSRAEEVIE
jgi:putative ABC transport system substrate-binding protein